MNRQQFFKDTAWESFWLALFPTTAAGIAVGVVSYIREIEHWFQLELITLPTVLFLSFLAISNYSQHVNRHLVK